MSRATVGGAIGEFKAHKWIRCGDRWVVGYDSSMKYTIIATYAYYLD